MHSSAYPLWHTSHQATTLARLKQQFVATACNVWKTPKGCLCQRVVCCPVGWLAKHYKGKTANEFAPNCLAVVFARGEQRSLEAQGKSS